MLPRYRPPVTLTEALSLLKKGKTSMADLEQAFAQTVGLPEVVWFPYARTAIHVYLSALNIKKRKAVLSPFNCLALGNALAYAKFTPTYIDTEIGGFNQDVNEFTDVLSRQDVGVGIVCSEWGMPTPLEEDLPTEKPILYDFALRSLSPTVPKNFKEEDAIVYSLGWGKSLCGLKGAMLCSANKEVAEKWRAIRDESLTQSSRIKDFVDTVGLYIAFQPWFFGLARQLHTKTSIGKRLAGNQTAEALMPSDQFKRASEGVFDFALKSLSQLEKLRRTRIEQTNRYREHLAHYQSDHLILPRDSYPLSHYPIRVSEPEKLYKHLLKKKVFTSRDLFSKLLSDYPWLTGEITVPLKNARQLTRSTLHLPLYFGLTASQQEFISREVAGFLEPQIEGQKGALCYSTTMAANS